MFHKCKMFIATRRALQEQICWTRDILDDCCWCRGCCDGSLSNKNMDCVMKISDIELDDREYRRCTPHDLVPAYVACSVRS